MTASLSNIFVFCLVSGFNLSKGSNGVTIDCPTGQNSFSLMVSYFRNLTLKTRLWGNTTKATADLHRKTYDRPSTPCKAFDKNLAQSDICQCISAFCLSNAVLLSYSVSYVPCDNRVSHTNRVRTMPFCAVRL